MLATTFVPLAGVVLVSLGARVVPWRRLPPRVALWSLTAIAAVSASAVVVAVVVLAGGFLLGTSVGSWLVGACSLFAGHHRIPIALGAGAVVMLPMVAWRLRAVAANAREQRLDGFHPLTVVTADEPVAFARSGKRGGVVISTGMLEALQPAERRVLFAHERAHVRARHDFHFLANQLAAAVLPWLTRLQPELHLAAERAADAAALVEVRGDRRLVATAIARAAIAADQHPLTHAAPAFTGSAVAFRVQSMLHPSRHPLLPMSATWTMAMIAAIGAAVFLHHLSTLLSHICT